MVDIKKDSRVCASIRIDGLNNATDASLLLISDLHLDSKKCDRRLLKRHLDQAKEKNAGILINGDLFDVMQGRNDRRRAHGSKRKELFTGSYFNEVVNMVYEFLEPYLDHILYIGKGNHETAVEKHNDVDLMEFLKYRILGSNPNSKIVFGLYESFIRITAVYQSTRRTQFKMYIHHGASGVSPVTRGVIEFARLAEVVPEADIIWLGHNHQRNMAFRPVLKLKQNGKVETEERVFIRSGAYKKDDSGEGWAKEKGMAPSSLGGWWIRFYVDNKKVKYNLITTD